MTRSENMSKLAVGDIFPTASIEDIDEVLVKFPPVFANAPATVIFFIAPLVSVVPGPGDGLCL